MSFKKRVKELQSTVVGVEAFPDDVPSMQKPAAIKNDPIDAESSKEDVGAKDAVAESTDPTPSSTVHKRGRKPKNEKTEATTVGEWRIVIKLSSALMQRVSNLRIKHMINGKLPSAQQLIMEDLIKRLVKEGV